MITKVTDGWDGVCLAFLNRDIVLREDGALPSYDDILLLGKRMDCGELFAEREYGYCAMRIKPKTRTADGESVDSLELLPEGFRCMAMRLYNDGQQEEMVLRISRAKALAEWLENTRYCPKCGKPLQLHDSLTALECECGNIVFPRIEPCIIVLVGKGRQMLLARHVQRNQNIYACIAGFMETGESAEQCVAREVFEETGIRIKNVRYFGSQSWPYPSQLMLGFTAEYESGELRLQQDELSDAGWFDVDNCPATPPPGSIAYRLIESFKG